MDTKDNRWGGYIPWFYRNEEFLGQGDFLKFFGRLSQRLNRLFLYNEPQIPNLVHFGDILETKSLQRFRHETKNLAQDIQEYFAPATIERDCRTAVSQRVLRDIPKQPIPGDTRRLATFETEVIMRKKNNADFMPIFNERLGVLEVLLRNLPGTSPWVTDLISDIRIFFTESGIMLNVDGNPPLIIPTEEPMLQHEVIDNLMPRLYQKYPDRAKGLVRCYHDLRKGERDLDSIFIEAVKNLEEIARSITGDSEFEFNIKNLNKYFPKLHKTIHLTMEKLAAHRGDEGGHGKDSPDMYEMRYLMFSVCNIALLLIEYPKTSP